MEKIAVPCESPVLLVIWNRPEETQKVLESLRVAQPARLYVAADGPRNEAEEALVHATRELAISMVDWPCEIFTNFAESNAGCRLGVSRAIDWFFRHETAGIILEDDCVPHEDFYRFCSELLTRYRDDDRIMAIAGDNTAAVSIEQDWSYCFVRYPHIWGWATWRRAWLHYDRDLDEWGRFRSSGQLADLFPDRIQRETWVHLLNRLLDEGVPDTWAWRWSATIMMRGGLCVQPVTNLVSNIGFNERATHTRSRSTRADAPAEKIYPLRHPPVAFPHLDAERQIFVNTQAGLHPWKRKRKWKKRFVRGKIELYRVAQRLGLRPSSRSSAPR